MKQIGEIEERVWSLSDVLRSPLKENDHSERIRRELFCRFVRPSPGVHHRLRRVLQEVDRCPRQIGTALRTKRSIEILAE